MGKSECKDGQGVPDVFILDRMDILGDKTHVMN